ncbi:MAG TPA: ATP-binding protein [Draconibacterium sp.]|nr:ATP-binding protein [Draconibacterium sp.]
MDNPILNHKSPVKENKTENLRHKAEMLVNKKVKTSELPLTDPNNLRLIHELEVHKIELEMQNEELKLAKEKAERAKKKYTELYDFAPSGYLTLTKAGEIIHLNFNAEQLLGKESSQLINSSFGFFVSSETRAEYNRFLQKIFNSKAKETCEFMLATDDDSIKYVLANGIISNNSKKCLLTLIDITERKQTESELTKAKEKAEEGERLKSAFLANMSHEIRTPMNGILGFAELLKDHKLRGEEQQKFIGIIEKSGTRLLNIINNIISLSKIESHQTEVTVTDTNVNEQVEFIYQFFKLEAEQKNLHLTFQNALSANDAYIKTDREKLYAVLTNLVKNAIKFTQTGSIEFGYKLKDEFLEFFVKDSGPGIPDEQKEIIFERFRQGSESLTRNYEGAGLGLSISKAYVEMLGGKIWVTNNPGVIAVNGNRLNTGSIFYFTLPAHSLVKPKKFLTDSTIDNEIKVPVRKLKILIIEDDQTSELLLRNIFNNVTREFLHVSNGIEAIITCKNNPDIDLILMDINLPGMNGYEATRKIREFNTEVIIIAQTAYAMAGDRENSILAGCNDYISKPINQIAIRKLVNSYFEKHQYLPSGYIEK